MCKYISLEKNYHFWIFLNYVIYFYRHLNLYIAEIQLFQILPFCSIQIFLELYFWTL